MSLGFRSIRLSLPPCVLISCPQEYFWLLSGLVALLKSKLLCLTYSEAKQYQNARVWNRERFITGPMKEMVAHARKCQIPQSFSKAFLKGT